MEGQSRILYPLFQYSKVPRKLRERLNNDVGVVFEKLGSCAAADLKASKPELLDIAYEWSTAKESRQATFISMCLAYIESLDFEAAKTIIGNSRCYQECDYVRDMLASDLQVYVSKPVPSVILKQIDKQLYAEQVKRWKSDGQAALTTYGQLALEDAQQHSPDRLTQVHATANTLAILNLINAYMALTYREDDVAEHAYKALLTFLVRNRDGINTFIQQYLAHVTLFIPGHDKTMSFISDYHRTITEIVGFAHQLWQRDPTVRSAAEFEQWSDFTDHITKALSQETNSLNPKTDEDMYRVSAILKDYE